MSAPEIVEVAVTLYATLPIIGHALTLLPFPRLQKLGRFLEAFGADVKKARDAVRSKPE